ELLVVIAIIGLLVSMLLPAVNAARESARRTQCQNHLKQLGLAYLSHESALNHFPTGGWDWDQAPSYQGGNPHAGAKQRAGWGFQVLPYVEASAVWAAGAEIAIKTPQALFFCPSRRGPQTVFYTDNYDPPVRGGELEHALCDYAASNREGAGVTRRFAPVESRQLEDGHSTTLMLGEKRLNLSDLGEPQDDDNEGYTAGWNSDTIRRIDQSPRPDFHGDGDGDGLFGSSHAAGINTVWADGSVHLIQYDIEVSVFERLGVIDDGQPVEVQ
ncbi:MAG: DUF1559 domain-containing protein, partial [Planctomycetales bacterium]|nr:DUF1559 domain-containing protein [Planctomycetales bacterium]